ncbi:TatD family hydrolase [Neisseria sp. Ec49-e6-T10]|uniref:TatD family hydrolase n=1 Tax=Neisseria sp. Ec49-e6-T10 TaxID=3140744 RepID=UPI003EC10006
MFIDTHCHLSNPNLLLNLDLHLQEAKAVAVTRFISPATSSKDYINTLNLAKKYPDTVYPAIGLHPYCVSSNWQYELSILTELLSASRVIALGEIGLDFYDQKLSTPDKDQQINAFIAQLQLARKFDLPVLLHNRKSVFKCIELLKKYPVKGGIAHAFSGSLQEAQEFIKLGFKLGLGTMLCRPNTPKLSLLAQQLPESSFVLETDSPDMPPVPYTINTPKNIILVAQKMAHIRHCSLEDIANSTTQNACTIFSW